MLTKPTHARIVKAARLYLERGEPQTEEWLGKNVFDRPATDWDTKP